MNLDLGVIGTADILTEMMDNLAEYFPATVQTIVKGQHNVAFVCRFYPFLIFQREMSI